jgi:enoyl-CoA hydratase/carnithine racemase
MDVNTGTDQLLAHVDDDGIGWMFFNNPSRHNALSVEMQLGIPRALSALDEDPRVRLIVVAGSGGRAFVSGADISEFGAKRTSVEARSAYDKATADSWQCWERVSKPIVAMIQGYCIGGGLIAALQADLRVCSDDSQFGVPAARLGLGYGFDGVQKLTRIVGPAWTSEILFSARRLNAEEALRIGLVNRVTSRGDLEPTVRELAGAIAANAPLTIATCKAAIRQTMKDAGDRDLAAIEAMVERCYLSLDYLEGQRAFMEKRDPVFTGR